MTNPNTHSQQLSTTRQRSSANWVLLAKLAVSWLPAFTVLSTRCLHCPPSSSSTELGASLSYFVALPEPSSLWSLWVESLVDTAIRSAITQQQVGPELPSYTSTTSTSPTPGRPSAGCCRRRSTISAIGRRLCRSQRLRPGCATSSSDSSHRI